MGTLLALWVLAASAVELPDSWRCRESELTAAWKGLKQVSQERGPNWGERLSDSVPTPFVWLAVYKDRDRDVAERRAPITQRWGEFNAAEKCAYLKHWTPEAEVKKREFDALTGWKRDGGLLKRAQKLAPEEVAEAQDKPPLAEWRARFEALRAWLTDQGLREDDPMLERASGVFIRLSQLDAAHIDFLRETRHFEARVRRRFAAGVSPPPALAALFESSRERVIADLAAQLAKDWRNEAILGADFERRLAESLREVERARAAEAVNARIGEVRRVVELSRAARKRAEKAVARLEGELKAEKLSFPAGADPSLLVGLEEYRQGTKRLHELAQDDSKGVELRAAYLDLLAEVCVAHYTGIRYKAEVVKTLCGR